MADATVTILGATGYTGRLCAAEAVAAGLPVRLAGRRRDALQALAETLPGDVELTAADVSDRASLAAVARSTSVLLTTVGPYERLGRPVFDAAVAAGCGYVDVSGETGFLAWVHDQAERARDAGTAATPGVGFDGVPGDLLAALAAESLGGDVDEARVGYLMREARPSAGTARTALGVLGGGGAAWRDGAVVREPSLAHSWRAPFPPPEGSRATASVPLPEVVTLGRTTGARVARAYAVVPGAALLPVAAGTLDVLGRVTSRTPLRDLAERLVDRLPDGPSTQARVRAQAVAVAMVRKGERTAQAWARVPDMYGVTAKISVFYARRILDGAVAPGVWTPSQAAPPRELLDLVATAWAAPTP